MTTQPNEELKPYSHNNKKLQDFEFKISGPGIDEAMLHLQLDTESPANQVITLLNFGYEQGVKTGRSTQSAPQGKREWKAESAWEVLEEFSKHPHRGWCNADPLATNPKDCNCYVGKSKKVLANRVLAALSGGGDERWEKEAPVAPVRKWEAEEEK